MMACGGCGGRAARASSKPKVIVNSASPKTVTSVLPRKTKIVQAGKVIVRKRV